MSRSVAPSLLPLLQHHLGGPILEATPLSGGDINDVYRLRTGRGDCVLKASRRALPHLFFAEVQGLGLLREAASRRPPGLLVPEVIAYGDAPGGWQYLLQSYLPPVAETPQSQEALGQGLAALHSVTVPGFGATADNYFGTLPQFNPPFQSAADFFWSARLRPQLRLAQEHLSADDTDRFEALRQRLPNLIPTEPSSLVHGDLWHGNLLYTAAGPALIDPAAAYSHREVDLAAMRLFGGVPERVFDAYAEAFPPAPGWQDRANLWNLYPLLAHVNMFGSGYLGRTRAALNTVLNL
ncbi:fructosamine kinase family protein [Deinococcus marmoris]|uniref:Ribulosamine/erythrulosamine 3-kinase potentially involved in protein deglycation n=1 Tax=Deinococcus marmoris TaxID=249408 RepID=A0A1U7NT68_9DEIO|nr:fructosamine kinase family protein [Deinococcus marmoris]OLV16110.1 Ribulosamine/erythrulosamine 3-kinase potentially involved in protein deglycation [Deinococcus marmoris]